MTLNIQSTTNISKSMSVIDSWQFHILLFLVTALCPFPTLSLVVKHIIPWTQRWAHYLYVISLTGDWFMRWGCNSMKPIRALPWNFYNVQREEDRNTPPSCKFCKTRQAFAHVLCPWGENTSALENKELGLGVDLWIWMGKKITFSFSPILTET